MEMGDFTVEKEAYKLADIELVEEGVKVYFEDGLTGLVKFDLLSTSVPITEVHLESPYNAILFSENDEEKKLPWDFFRRELDAEFRSGEEKTAVSARQRLGRRIKKIRNVKNVTQAELATRAGLNRTTISRIETGKHPANFDTLHDISAALDVSLPELVTLDKPVEKVA